MYPRNFDYVRAGSLAEALDLLAEHGDDGRPLAGGQSLIPLMKLRLVSPRVLVDLNGIPGLDYVKEEDGWLRIGALTRHAAVARDRALCAALPVLGDAVREVGDIQVRNLGTVIGALVEADPAGDWGPVLLALDGQVVCTRQGGGERTIEGSAFFEDFLTPALETGELATELRLPKPRAGSGGAYLKLERRVGDFAVVGAAVHLTLAEDGTCEEIGVGLSGVGSTPIKPTEAENALRGRRLDQTTILEASHLLDAVIDPTSDARGPADYKREMVAVYFRRAVERARQRAMGAAPNGHASV